MDCVVFHLFPLLKVYRVRGFIQTLDEAMYVSTTNRMPISEAKNYSEFILFVL